MAYFMPYGNWYILLLNRILQVIRLLLCIMRSYMLVNKIIVVPITLNDAAVHNIVPSYK